MELVQSCPVCETEIRSDDLFCDKCGSNVQVNRIEFSEIQPSDAFKNKIQELHYLTVEMRNLLFLEATIEEQNEYIAAQNYLLAFVSDIVSSLDKQIKDADQKLSALNSISMTALIAKLKRQKQEKQEKLQVKLEDLYEKRTLLNIHQNLTTHYLEISYADFTKLQSLIEKKKEIEDRVTALMASIESDIFHEQIQQKLDAISKYKDDLIEVGGTYRRLKISNRYIRSSLKDIEELDSLEQEGDEQHLSAVELLTQHYQLFDIDIQEIPLSMFLVSNIWKKIQGAITYGKALGELVIEIKSAGTFTISTIFEGIVSEDTVDLEYIMEHMKDINTELELKRRYIDGILEIIKQDYDEVRGKIEDEFNSMIQLQLQRIKT